MDVGTNWLRKESKDEKEGQGMGGVTEMRE